MHDLYYNFARFSFYFRKNFAEKKQKKKNAGQQNDESVVNSSNNAPVDDSQKALTGDVLLAESVPHDQTCLVVKSFP